MQSHGFNYNTAYGHKHDATSARIVPKWRGLRGLVQLGLELPERRARGEPPWAPGVGCCALGGTLRTPAPGHGDPNSRNLRHFDNIEGLRKIQIPLGMVALSCGCRGDGLFYVAGEHVLLQSACDWHLLLRPFRTSHREIRFPGCGWIASTGLSISGASCGMFVHLCSIVIEPM